MNGIGVEVRLLLVLATLAESLTECGTDALLSVLLDVCVDPPIGAFATRSLIVLTAMSIDFFEPLT